MRLISFLFILAVFTFSCKKKDASPKMVQFGGETQGTYYRITYFSTDSIDYQREIDSIFGCVNRSVSLWDTASIISRINRNDTAVETDDIFNGIYKIAREVSEMTGGALDVTVGPLVDSWGFGPGDSVLVSTVPIETLLPYVGYRKIKIGDNKLYKDDPKVRMDFNAIAQGYTVDLVAGFLESKGIQNYLVDIGGEVLAKGNKPGNKPWQVGVEKPAENKDASQELQAVVELKDMALSTSGNYRKYYMLNGKKLSHTIDPTTGKPVDHSLLSVSVLCNRCGEADAYATAFMVMGLEKAKSFLEKNKTLEAYFIYSDEMGSYQVYYTPGFGKILKDNGQKQ